MGKTRNSFAILFLATFSLGLGMVGCSTGGQPAQEVTYTVSFNTNGGSEVAPVSVKHGEKLTKPANPTKENYEFVAWYEDSYAITEFNFNIEITADWTLYAGWKASSTPTPTPVDPVEDKVVITFDATPIASWSPAPSDFAIHAWNGSGTVSPEWNAGSAPMEALGNNVYTVSFEQALTGAIMRFKQGSDAKQTVDIAMEFALGHTYSITVQPDKWTGGKMEASATMVK